MTDRDIAEIRIRLAGSARLARKLDAIAAVLLAGKVTILDDETLPLAAAQKTGIKTRFTALLASARALADSLPVPTGVVGVPNDAEVINTPPPRVMELVQEWRGNFAQVIDNPALQADGTVATVFTAEQTQQIADIAATLRDMLKGIYTTLEGKVP